MSDKGLEIGNLAPFRTLLAEVSRWEADDRARRPENDPALMAVEKIRRGLQKALDDAQGPMRPPTVAELAEIEGVSTWAIYRRRSRKRAAERKAAA